MYAAALAIMGSEEEASDAVQSTMLRVWEKVSTGVYPDSPQAYCLSAIRNICITEAKRSSRNVSLDDSYEISTDKNGIEDAVELNEVKTRLRQLPANEQRAVVMSAYAGSSADDIAEVLGVSTVNARKILSRGRRRLRSLFSK